MTVLKDIDRLGTALAAVLARLERMRSLKDYPDAGSRSGQMPGRVTGNGGGPGL